MNGSTEDVSDYEKRRLERIAENQKYLLELGLATDESFSSSVRKNTSISPAPKKRKSVAASPSVTTRRITRRSLQSEDQLFNDTIESDSEPVPSSKKKEYRPNHYGAIEGVKVGDTWEYRLECSFTGAHRPTVAGIHGGPEGAYSIALSGGYEDDVDSGDHFTYTGAGGRDLKGTKANPKNLRTAPQSKDQTADGYNAALIASVQTKNPVRVIRGYKLKSIYAPESGYRYDGLYTVDKYWTEVGIAGYLVYKFSLSRLKNQDPPPWISDNNQENDKQRSNRQGNQNVSSSLNLSPDIKKMDENLTCNSSPKKTSISPKKVSISPKKALISPKKVLISPKKTSISPKKALISPKKASISSVKTPRKCKSPFNDLDEKSPKSLSPVMEEVTEPSKSSQKVGANRQQANHSSEKCKNLLFGSPLDSSRKVRSLFVNETLKQVSKDINEMLDSQCDESEELELNGNIESDRKFSPLKTCRVNGTEVDTEIGSTESNSPFKNEFQRKQSTPNKSPNKNAVPKTTNGILLESTNFSCEENLQESHNVNKICLRRDIFSASSNVASPSKIYSSNSPSNSSSCLESKSTLNKKNVKSPKLSNAEKTNKVLDKIVTPMKSSESPKSSKVKSKVSSPQNSTPKSDQSFTLSKSALNNIRKKGACSNTLDRYFTKKFASNDHSKPNLSRSPKDSDNSIIDESEDDSNVFYGFNEISINNSKLRFHFLLQRLPTLVLKHKYKYKLHQFQNPAKKKHEFVSKCSSAKREFVTSIDNIRHLALKISNFSEFHPDAGFIPECFVKCAKIDSKSSKAGPSNRKLTNGKKSLSSSCISSYDSSNSVASSFGSSPKKYLSPQKLLDFNNSDAEEEDEPFLGFTDVSKRSIILNAFLIQKYAKTSENNVE